MEEQGLENLMLKAYIRDWPQHEGCQWLISAIARSGQPLVFVLVALVGIRLTNKPDGIKGLPFRRPESRRRLQFVSNVRRDSRDGLPIDGRRR